MARPTPTELDFSRAGIGPLDPHAQARILLRIWNHHQVAGEAYACLPWHKKGAAGTGASPTQEFLDFPPGHQNLASQLGSRTQDRFFTPNLFARRSAKDVDVLQSRVLFQDLDEVNPWDIPEDLTPTIAWRTSEASYQAVWLLEGKALTVDEHRDWNRRLQHHLGVKVGRSPCALIRVPGRRNWKAEYGFHGSPGIHLWDDGPTHDLSSPAWQTVLHTPPKTTATPDEPSALSEALMGAVDVTSVVDDLPLRLRRQIEREPAPNRKSDDAHALTKDLFKHGLDADQVAAVLRTSRPFLAKFGDRLDPMKELDREVRNARNALSREGWIYDISTATVQEPNPDFDKMFSLTEAANGDRLIGKYGDDIHYVPEWRAWIVSDGGQWVRDDVGKVREYAKECARDLLAGVADLADRQDRNRVSRFAMSSLSARGISATLASAQSLPGASIDPKQLDADPWLFNCVNVTIDLRTNEPRQHRRGDLLTKQSGVFWDPNAKCPTWDAALARWFPDPTVRRYVQRAIGYSMTGSLREKCFFLMEGQSNAGKNKFSEGVRHVMGDYGTSAGTYLLEKKRHGQANNDALANLHGARYVSISELTPDMRLDVQFLKNITGVGDGVTIKAMRKYESEFEFIPQMTLWIDTNHTPRLGHRDDAMYNRFKKIPFGPAIPRSERDPMLAERLAAEASGILNWMLEGLREWREHGLMEPDAVKSAVAAQREEEDTFGQFLETQCIPTTHKRGDKKTILKEAFREWAGWDKITPRNFDALLAEHGVGPDKPVTVDGKTQRTLPLRLRNESDEIESND